MAITLTPAAVFLVLAAVRVLAALYSPIADCDETYNYWEPMHYLMHGFGFQTWEYSPEFALRSYAYLYPYVFVAKLSAGVYTLLKTTFGISLISSPKIFIFYGVRVCMGIASAFAETVLFNAVRRRFGRFVAALFFVFLASSPGMFRSSVEFLPSTFSMVLLAIAHALWMENQLFLATFCVAVASLLGWVFSAILAVPLALDILLRKNGIVIFLTYASVSALAVIAFMGPVDTYYFGKPVIAPLNHILYNVFPREGAGSQIFGVESWGFYVKNLALNCNLAAVLYGSLPIFLLVGILSGLPEHLASGLKDRLRFLSGSYLAMIIFVLQPHKEERFLVPCYPYIALAASIVLNDSMRLLSTAIPSRRSMFYISILVCFPILISSCLLGLSRIIMQVKSFRSPLTIYEHLSTRELGDGHGPRDSLPELRDGKAEINICMGSEWYRFPTSFFIPDKRFRARFVHAQFDGLLPKPFQETDNGTKVHPPGMNEYNQADPQQFYDWEKGTGCHYYVHLDLSHRVSDSSPQQTRLPARQEDLHVLVRAKFLDSEASPGVFRAFYVPGFDEKLTFAEYQLMRNIRLNPFESETA